MSAHLMRFLMAFAGMLSLRSNTPASLVNPDWLTALLFACQRHRQVTDQELNPMSPERRVRWLISNYRAVLHARSPATARTAGAKVEPTHQLIEDCLADVQKLLPELQGDLSIDAINKALGLPCPESLRDISADDLISDLEL